MTAARLSPLLVKEIRGLSTVWLLAVASIALGGLGGPFSGLASAAYFLGAVALGALSMGHEYNHGTVALLLSQPVRRTRLMLLKLGVLVPMLIALGAVAWVVLFDVPDNLRALRPTAAYESQWRAWALVLPLLCGLLLAPWLTMICRNPLAGIVFTVACPAMLWLGAEIVRSYRYGGAVTSPEAVAFTFGVVWWGTLSVALFAAVSGWRRFMRLEAIDGRGADLDLPFSGHRAANVATLTRRHPVWLLLKKELRLQQLTLAISSLYIFAWFTIAWLGAPTPERQALVYGLTLLHGAAIPLLAGSLASAEERHLGTLEPQQLMPIAAWKQWILKAGTAIGLALLLAAGLPALLLSFNPALQSELNSVVPESLVALIVLAAALSLYVSSLSASSLRALLISMFATFLVIVALATVESYRWRYGLAAPVFPVRFVRLRTFPHDFSLEVQAWWTLMTSLSVILYAGVVGLLMGLALANHRSADRSARRLSRQLSGLVAFLIIGLALRATASGYYFARFDEERQPRIKAMQERLDRLRNLRSSPAVRTNCRNKNAGR